MKPAPGLQHVMRDNRELLGNYIYLKYQPHKVTDYNINHLVYSQKIVGFASHSQNSENVVGMSLHTSCKTKVGLVVFICYRGNSLKDFEKHLKCNVDYVYHSGLNKKQGFHICADFSSDFPYSKVLKMCFDIGLVPGIRDIASVLVLRDLVAYKNITCPTEKAHL